MKNQYLYDNMCNCTYTNLILNIIILKPHIMHDTYKVQLLHDEVKRTV